MQDEVNEKVVSLCISGGKISARILKNVLMKYLQEVERREKQRAEKSAAKGDPDTSISYRGKISMEQLLSLTFVGTAADPEESSAGSSRYRGSAVHKGRPYNLQASHYLCRCYPAFPPAKGNSSVSFCISVSCCARSNNKHSPGAYPAHISLYPFSPSASCLPFHSSSSRNLSSLAPTTIQQYSPNKSRNTSIPPAAINHFISIHLFFNSKRALMESPRLSTNAQSYRINPVSFFLLSSRQRRQ